VRRLQRDMKVFPIVCLGLALSCASAAAQEFPSEQIKKGADLFATNCATCHGEHMRNPQWAFDLRTFPHDGHTRFVNSVTYGKGGMPPWEDVLNRDEIEELWSYVVAGEPGD
jgi:mono/diheme cytochrome c family protein